jgi:uncharacterized membrane protein
VNGAGPDRLFQLSLLLLALLASTPVALSYSFDDYAIEIRPSDESVRETVSFLIANDLNTSLSGGNYTIATSISNVRVFDEEGLLRFSVTELDGATTITYDYRSPLGQGDSARISISFNASGMVGRNTYVGTDGIEREDRVVSTGFNAPAPIGALLVRVKLPEGAWLARSLSDHATVTGSPVQPLDGFVESNGTNLEVSWTRTGVPGGERFDFFVAYHMPEREVRADTGSILMALGAGIVVGIAVAFLFLRRKSVETRTEHTLALLEEGERKILKIIMDHGGEFRQDELIEASGYSKARVSQLVTRLEKLGLVRKERFERTNKLFVTGEVREV